MRNKLLLTISIEIVTTALGAVSGILLARLLAPEGRGELAALMLWPGMLLTLGGLGIPHTIAYFTGSHSQNSGSIFGTAFALAGVQTAVIISAGYLVIPLALRNQYGDVIPLSLIYLVTVPMSLAAGISLGVLQGALDMRGFNALRVMQSSLHLGGVATLWLVRAANLHWVVGLYVGNLFVAACVGIGLAWRKVGYRAGWDSDLAKQMVSYGIKTQISNMAQSLNLRLDQLIMSLFLAPGSLGLYVVAVTFSKLLNPISHAIGIIILPAVARSNRVQVTHQLGILFRSNLLILLLLGGVLIITLPLLLPLLVGKAYSEAVVPAQVLAIGAVFLGMNDVLSEALRGLNRPGVPTVAQIISLVLTIILLYLLLPTMGVLGAALTSVIAYAATFAFQFRVLQRSVHLGWKDMVPNGRDWQRLWSVAHSLVPRRSRVHLP